MANVIFNFEGNDYIVQCNINDQMSTIISNFLNKSEKDEDSNLFYSYGGSKINLELTFEGQANAFDKEKKEMKILVYEFNNNNKVVSNKIISNEIICPTCTNNTFININDYKANLFIAKINIK